MKIVLRLHLKIRLKQREIPLNYPEEILQSPDSQYSDNETGHLISVKSLRYFGKIRPMVVAYVKINSEIQVITVYPTTFKEISNRLKSGRWTKHEKN